MESLIILSKVKNGGGYICFFFALPVSGMKIGELGWREAGVVGRRLIILLPDYCNLMNGISVCRFDIQQVGSRHQRLQIDQGDFIEPLTEGSAQHPHDPGGLQISQQNDTIHVQRAGHFYRKKITKRIRVNRNLGSYNHFHVIIY
jgi:hypothetical protein